MSNTNYFACGRTITTSKRWYQLDGSRLLKIFFPNSIAKATCFGTMYVCQRCRNVYNNWHREVDGDFDNIDESFIVMEQDEESANMNGDAFV